ncbi:glycoside hydrolase family 13 and glycosyltransferase family 5 protein [Schizophyllum commune]
MRSLLTGALSAALGLLVAASPYREELEKYNINTNKDATDPLDYSTDKLDSYMPSPDNWRALPVYTILMDKYADGDPTNNDFFGTPYEQDYRETQMRYGGDLKGLVSKLDYLQGMGIRVIFISGTPFLNMIWQADSYSPLDMSVLDPHWGTIDDWVDTIKEIHNRGMYFMADLTVGTMSDLIGFKGYLNVSAPFMTSEHDYVYKHPPRMPWGFDEYADFKPSNDWNSSCVLPRFWGDDGERDQVENPANGCKASEFDQYGDLEAFGVHPEYKRQLTKFSSVQDRLREWQPHVLAKLKVFACMVVTRLDIDAIRIDKSTQVSVDALAEWSASLRKCANDLGKDNFFIPGEVTGGDHFGSIYIGRGRAPENYPEDFGTAVNATLDDSKYFLRDAPLNALDGVAFHYSTHRAITRFMGLDGQLTAAYDTDVNFANQWNELMVHNDFLNPATGDLDPRHLYGTSNFDIFRWQALQNGTQRAVLASFITSMIMPGTPLYFFGEEQNFYIHDNTASNYLFGRQGMMGNVAWKNHGCYHLGFDQYYVANIEKAYLGCYDDWNALDHFDPTANSRRMFAHFNYLRTVYGVIQDGFSLTQTGNWTYFIQMPYSGDIQTEKGLWAVKRDKLQHHNTVDGRYNDPVWLFYTNENTTQTYDFKCGSKKQILSPFQSSVKLRNLFAPYETYDLEQSDQPYYYNGEEPYFGCLGSITFEPYGFKALVPDDQWVAPLPAMTKFTPGHDHRITSQGGKDDVDISIEFNTEMDCDSVTDSITLTMSSSGGGDAPSISNVNCGGVDNPDPVIVPGDDPSAWAWSATLSGMPDGVLRIEVKDPSSNGGDGTNATDHLLLRKGTEDNVMVFPYNDYNNSAFVKSGDDLVFNHRAYGADKFRYSWNFGQNWTEWKDFEEQTKVNTTLFDDEDNFWDGYHIMVQYWSELSMSTSHVTHADYNYDDHPRRVPRFLARGEFNNFGFDKAVESEFKLNDEGLWQLDLSAVWPTWIQLNVFDYNDYWYGDVDNDGILDRLPPNTAAPSQLNISAPPGKHLSFRITVDDSTMRWYLEPRGQASVGIITYALLLSIPFITALASVLIFMRSFYGIKHNRYGVQPSNKGKYFPIMDLFGKSKSDLHDPEGAGGLFGGHKKYHGDIIGWPEDKNKRRKVLIATLEYEIIDWKLKVKIGGLGVMASLMGKAMSDVDLVWVVAKVKDLEYPPGDPAEPIEVIIFGQAYQVEVETHVVDNITYVILDSPVFRAQSKADPYPQRMDDLSSAIFYSTWNQAIAATIRRYPDIDIYHINDYHGALAPIYLLPKVIPVCLSLHNAEFQGLWPLRTKEEMKEVCSAFNISKAHCTKYVQFGNTFNLLHAAASFISVHQKSVGVAGVSDKYGKRSWARYPALWALKHVDSLPNPDPTDIDALDENPTEVRKIQIDQEAEAKRPENKRQAQEWAGIKQDPNANLFVFVGRWSKQKGVDLIADVMTGLLEKQPSIQLICVGPVIDLYGRFAAEKLARLMELYPDRVYSKPEFTALPPYLFSGADFALIPSRDEPFGLVAVEFGRKGALGVGSRLGGLGLMPGWWFPVESSSTAHMISQFTKTIKMALKSTEEERAILRARSAVQRFPVVEWRQRMEDFHKRSITTSRTLAESDAWRPSDGGEHTTFGAIPENEDWNPEALAPPQQPNWGRNSMSSIGGNSYMSPVTPGTPQTPLSSDGDSGVGNDYLSARPQIVEPNNRDSVSEDGRLYEPGSSDFQNFLSRANKAIAHNQRGAPDPFLDGAAPARPFTMYSRVSSAESIASIVDEKADSPLNKAIASFTDADGAVAAEFVQKLRDLNPKNSEHELSIEKYLMKSEEAFFEKVRKDKLSTAASLRSHKHDGASTMHSRPSSVYTASEMGQRSSVALSRYSSSADDAPLADEPDIVPMNRTQIFMSRELGGWPLYTILMALAQMLSATSFQIGLLSGTNRQNDTQFYIIGGVFLAASAVWYPMFRLKPSVYILSIPWIFFGIAFFLIGLPYAISALDDAREGITNGATWAYAIASAGSFAFFGLNFGEEAGAATEVWMLRACIVQGSQQIWVAALWYWGHNLAGKDDAYRAPWWVACIAFPLAAMSFLFFWLLYHGLPEYYRQKPPQVPQFLKTMFRRHLVLWFLASEILRDYWLSVPYGRNWTYLWSVPIPVWQTVVLVIVFFVFVWALLMFVLTHFAKTHTWLLPVFAVGLGAPRWCQMLWGTSSVGLYLPWAGDAGYHLGISLWLWLGVLDAVQGVGLGMILLQTLSRLHVCATLAFSQVIGSIVVMIARATAPPSTGATGVFPDVAKWEPSEGVTGSPIASPLFWIALICQLIIVAGYFWFYRKEQLSKP